MKVAGGNCGKMVKAARQCAKERKEWSALVHMLLIEFYAAIFSCTMFFRSSLPCSGGYHLEGVRMPYYDAVGINFKKGSTTEKKCAGVKHLGKGEYAGLLCAHYLT